VLLFFNGRKMLPGWSSRVRTSAYVHPVMTLVNSQEVTGGLKDLLSVITIVCDCSLERLNHCFGRLVGRKSTVAIS
jgi:hypothetical protein